MLTAPAAIKLGLTLLPANGPERIFWQGAALSIDTDRGIADREGWPALLGRASARAGLLVGAGGLAGAAGLVLPDYSLPLTAAALALCCLAVLLRGLARVERRGLGFALRQIALLVEEDGAACFATDAEGGILLQNAAARRRFEASSGGSLAGALADHFASPGAVLYRLQSRALARGSAQEDVVTRWGHTRLSVHRVGRARFLWRLEDLLDRGAPGRGAEALSLPMLVANRQGVVLFMNEAMRRLLGGRPRTLDRIFLTADLQSGAEVRVTTETGQVRAILAEIEGPGERRELYLLPQSGQTVAQPLGSDLDRLPVALLRLSGAGVVLSANAAARDLLRMEAGVETRLGDLVEGLGRSVGDWVADVQAGRLPESAEVLHLRRGDAEAFVQIALRRSDEEGHPTVLAVVNDATALKSLEAQFTQSQKMQAVGQLAGGIAHDFNNLLTAISGHCDLLLLRHGREEPDYADLVQIRQNANRAAALVGQLLAFSRKQTLCPQRIDLQEVLSDMTHLLNRLVGERTRVELRHSPGLGAIRADKRQLEQVLMNLVVNARDAMPGGGTIRIRTEAVSLAAPMTRDRAVVPPGDYALIYVSDEGVGIPPDRIGKIFEPFYTTKRPGEGTGLGLSMVYGIVKQSGGFVFVESEPDRGTRFELYFPIHRSNPAEEAAEREAAVLAEARRMHPRLGEGVVLLVEDEAPVRAFAARALRLRGYTVLEAESAEQALAILDDPSVVVDIFVTDVVMPDMDGPSWVRKALERRPGVKVVFVSGYTEESFADRQDRIANSVFLPKPFSLNDLAATVQGQLLH
jgi:two-component system cell cycle sensor histidine kinase/response regulator CckA